MKYLASLPGKSNIVLNRQRDKQKEGFEEKETQTYISKREKENESPKYEKRDRKKREREKYVWNI